MAAIPPHLPAHTILLSAGPHAGKTTLLLQWRQECSAPSIYLALTKEDADPAFFIHRFLREWPEIRARFMALTTEFHAMSSGAALGAAIAETHPDFCLFLDAFEQSEDTALFSELMALFRQFPQNGTLAIASRHQLPEIPRQPLSSRDADDPLWNETPTLNDLAGLPASLFVKALVLHIVGEADHSSHHWSWSAVISLAKSRTCISCAQVGERPPPRPLRSVQSREFGMMWKRS